MSKPREFVDTEVGEYVVRSRATTIEFRKNNRALVTIPRDRWNRVRHAAVWVSEEERV